MKILKKCQVSLYLEQKIPGTNKTDLRENKMNKK